MRIDAKHWHLFHIVARNARTDVASLTGHIPAGWLRPDGMCSSRLLKKSSHYWHGHDSLRMVSGGMDARR